MKNLRKLNQRTGLIQRHLLLLISIRTMTIMAIPETRLAKTQQELKSKDPTLMKPSHSAKCLIGLPCTGKPTRTINSLKTQELLSKENQKCSSSESIKLINAGIFLFSRSGKENMPLSTAMET